MNKRSYFFKSWRETFQFIGLAIAVILLAAIATGQTALATSVYDIPVVSSNSQPSNSQPWVIDQGEVLSRVTQSTLNQQLGALADKTGIKTRFITIRWLDYGDTVDSFAEKLFQEWFPTEAEQSHQALMVLDTKTNTLAMHTGADVEAIMPESIANSIATETALFPIRNGSYNQGLLDASRRLAAVLSGEADPGPPVIAVVDIESTFKSAEETDAKSATIIVVILLILATVIPMVTYYWYQSGS